MTDLLDVWLALPIVNQKHPWSLVATHITRDEADVWERTSLFKVSVMEANTNGMD